MTRPMVIGEPDRPNRRVLLAVELVDPFARSLISNGITVTAAGMRNPPIVNRAGRFVWLMEDKAWPSRIVVTPQDAPYAPQIVAAPPRPADVEKMEPEDRRMTIILRPDRAYAAEDGVTGIRGRLRETAAKTAAPISGARVQLAWFNHPQTWLPPKPAPENAGADSPTAPSPAEVETDADGEFLALLRLPATADPYVENGLIKVRLQVTRGRVNPATRATPDNFKFIPGAGQPAGVIPEGRVLASDVRLSWADLQSI